MLIEGMVFVLWIFSGLVTGLLILLETKGWTKFELEI